MEKIFITGTGRCGTTFLIKLFSFLEFNTGYSRNNYKNSINSKCNSGMEKEYNEHYYIIKNPRIMEKIDNIINDNSIKIKTIIIPVRDFKQSSISREKNGDTTQAGGLWNANDVNTQILFYNNIMSKYIVTMTQYEINTIFLDFNKMVNDKKYLFEKLNSILIEKNIQYDHFCKIYNEVSLNSKPK